MIAYHIFLERLLSGYQSSYDIEKIENIDECMPLVAKAHFHLTESQCVVFKEFSMWTAESNEYVYIFHVPKLTDEIAEKIIQYTYDMGMPLIQLEEKNFKRQHMCTRFVALVITEEASPDAQKRMKKCKIYKNFNFSLKGWMEMHTVVVDLQKEQVIGNRYARETVKFIKELISYIRKMNDKSKLA